MMGQWLYKDFIMVPTSIENYEDITFVLNQLKNLRNKKVIQWRKKYGIISKEQAFGYVIGLMISDADKDRGLSISSRIRIGLSKRYDWNITIGEALCYCLSILGVHAKRVKDGKPQKRAPSGRYIWRSELTPFITWLKGAVLGLKPHETTTYTKVKMPWVYSCPKEMLIWVLNGIYDGDGCAYIRGWQITNAARPNQDFINNILKRFKIKSVTRGPKSIIETKGSLVSAASLPIFRFATGKVEKTKHLIKMMENSNFISERDDYNKIMKNIFTLYRKGISQKDIPFHIYKKYKIGVHPRRIYTVLKRGDLFDV